jgi:hypothetical protein
MGPLLAAFGYEVQGIGYTSTSNGSISQSHPHSHHLGEALALQTVVDERIGKQTCPGNQSADIVVSRPVKMEMEMGLVQILISAGLE